MSQFPPAGPAPDLGAPRSVWRAHATRLRLPTLDRDLHADVVVVGGGITGLTTAMLLHHAGVDVSVVEALRVGEGVTGNSTGHLTELVDAGYRSLRNDFGGEAAALVRSATRLAIEEVRRLSEAYASEARYGRVPAFLFAASPDDDDAVGEEAEAAAASGVPAERVRAVPLPGPDRPAVHVPDQAQFDPLAYALGLARALAAAGVPVYEGVRVQAIEPGEPVQLRTEGGPTLTARCVVLATHTPLGFNPLQTVVFPYRSYVLGFTLPDGDYPGALYFDTANPYRYLRHARYEDERVLIVGGADHKTGEGGEDDAPYREVLDYVRRLYPGAAPRYRWSAEVFEPADGLPYVGPSPLQEGVLVATGFSGDGLLWGTLAARLLADLARDVESRYADLLCPTRFKPLAGGFEFLKENVDVAVRFVADRFATDVDAVSRLRPGEGGLVKREGAHLAVYRDDAGHLHALSPVCPHLKCVVRWNGADRTWDCPCHGSRFAPTGEPLSGPTMHGLEPKPLPEPAGA
jgi:glycine/D-amino acid oxidase-like deaminating enzyme/nitrite reductase/ring-hydroxylating ferredoxin subunit